MDTMGREGPLLRARGLRKEYGKGDGLVRAVAGIDLDVARGQTLAVMGPSGCGKSTLLHLLGGLDRPSGGELWLNGRRIDRLGERALARMRRREVGLVFQAFHLMDELTAKENVVLALCAAGVGLLAGRLAAPVLSGPGAGLVGAPGAPSLGASAIGLVAAMALGVAVVATFGPAIRAARISTVSALDDAARTPRRRASVVAISAHLPATLLLGVRMTARRPRRLVLSALSVAVTTSGIVAVLVIHAAGTGSGGFLTPGNPQSLRLDQVTSVVSVMLIVLAAVNATFIAWSTALEARHSSALARALGATPRQVSTGLAMAQMLPALAGALLGIPGGVGIYDAASNGGSTTVPPTWWLAAMVAGTVAVVAVLTVMPARIDARRPVAEILQAETV